MKKLSLLLLAMFLVAALTVTCFAADKPEGSAEALPVLSSDTITEDTELPDMYAIPSTLNDGYNIYHRHSSMQTVPETPDDSEDAAG